MRRFWQLLGGWADPIPRKVLKQELFLAAVRCRKVLIPYSFKLDTSVDSLEALEGMVSDLQLNKDDTHKKVDTWFYQSIYHPCETLSSFSKPLVEVKFFDIMLLFSSSLDSRFSHKFETTIWSKGCIYELNKWTLDIALSATGNCQSWWGVVANVYFLCRYSWGQSALSMSILDPRLNLEHLKLHQWCEGLAEAISEFVLILSCILFVLRFSCWSKLSFLEL